MCRQMYLPKTPTQSHERREFNKFSTLPPELQAVKDNLLARHVTPVPKQVRRAAVQAK